MKPRNTIPRNGPVVQGDRLTLAMPAPFLFFLNGKLPDAINQKEAYYRQEKGEMLRRELVAFHHSMNKAKGPRQRELLATKSAEILAVLMAEEGKSFERVGRDTIRRIWHQRVAEGEAEYLREVGYAMN